MHAKLFAPLMGSRIQPGAKFPQLRLKSSEHRRITHHRHCDIPLSVFHEESVAFAARELAAGRVVEVRRDDNRLVALAFFEPQLQRVDVFDLTPKEVTMLPTISEDFFVARMHNAWERRRKLLHQSQNNTFRVVNGSSDGLPALYIDSFSDSFARVIATSAGAERLLPATAEFLRRRGAEQILLDSPTLGSGVRLNTIKPTKASKAIYVEGGIRHLWPEQPTTLPTLENRLLINTAHRRARRMIRDLGKGKRVLCVNDRSGSAAMNAVMTAKQVTVVEGDAAVLDWVRENLVVNHTQSVFKNCNTVHSTLAELDLGRQYDVVFLEYHPDTLATPDQWRNTLVGLTRKGIIGVGTIVVMAQEAAPLGISDLVRRRVEEMGKPVPALRKEVAQAVRDAAEECALRVRFLRAFSPSVDFPLLPEGDSVSFSLTYFFEGPVIE